MQKIGINIEKIKEVLPHGAMIEIAEKSKASYDTVRRVLNGKSGNKEVITALKEYVGELRDVKENLNHSINMLCD